MKKQVRNHVLKNIKNKKFVIPIIILILLIAGGLIYYFVNNKNDKFIVGETLKITDSSDYLVQYDNGDYYLMKANADIKFNVSSQDEEIKYKIVDEEEQEIQTKISKKKNDYVIASNKNYEAGKTYKITLENATFTDEKLKDIKTLYFTIVRPNSNTQVLNDNVIKVDKDIITSVKIDDNYYTITSNKEFKKDDILYYQNENQVIAFKVNNINKENALYTIKTNAPTLEELFKELDIYGEFNLKLNDFITNEELKDYIKVAIAKDRILDNIIPNVYAEDIFNVKVESQKDGSAKVLVSINLNHGEKSIFKDTLENHDMKLDVEFIIRLKAHSDITFFKHDVGASLDIDINTDFNINPIDDDFKLFESEINDNEEVNITLAREKLEDLKMDSSKEEDTLGKHIIPTPIFGLTVNLELDLLKELELALKSSITMKSNINILFGHNNKGFYKDFDLSVKDSSYDILGKAEAKIGLDPKVNISFLGVMEAGIKAPVGLYADGQLNYIKSNNQDELDGKMEIGTFVSAGLYANFHIWKLEIAKAEATYEKKIPIITLEGKIKDKCEEQLLNGDFSCYVGTYSNSSLTISKDGTFTTKWSTQKYQSVKKRDDGSYYIITGTGKTETGYDIESGYYIYPTNVDDKGKIQGLTGISNLDQSKIRVMKCTDISCESAYQKD